MYDVTVTVNTPDREYDYLFSGASDINWILSELEGTHSDATSFVVTVIKVVV